MTALPGGKEGCDPHGTHATRAPAIIMSVRARRAILRPKRSITGPVPRPPTSLSRPMRGTTEDKLPNDRDGERASARQARSGGKLSEQTSG